MIGKKAQIYDGQDDSQVFNTACTQMFLIAQDSGYFKLLFTFKMTTTLSKFQYITSLKFHLPFKSNCLPLKILWKTLDYTCILKIMNIWQTENIFNIKTILLH